MAEKWKKFEKECYRQLESLYSGICNLEAYGQSDSTKADIKVITKNNNEFFIEVKDKKSQCCQFVLFPNEEKRCFDFSDKNRVPFTENCKSIIEYMNNHFDYYKNVSTKGLSINVDKKILYGLVYDFYTVKNVKYFMTKGKEYIVFPIDKFSEYFDIGALYRKKKCGSSEPNEKNNNEELINVLNDEKIDYDLEYIKVGKKTRCFIHTDQNFDKIRLIGDYYTYLFKNNEYSQKLKKEKNYIFELRRLSNTSNPNVICQLTLKKDIQEQEDLERFERAIKE